MNFSDLQTIYPSGSLQEEPGDSALFLNLEVQQRFFLIPLEKINASEAQLLQHLFKPSSKQKQTFLQHPWYAYLYEKSSSPASSGQYRIIQMMVQFPRGEEEKDEWLEAFQSIFANTVDAFFVTHDYAILIEKKSKNIYSPAEISAILQTLDSDFSTKTRIFIGSFFQNDYHLPDLFKEEQSIFYKEQPLNQSRQVMTLTSVALHYYTHEALSQSAIVEAFKNSFVLDTEIQEVINALWKNHGNISSAAKDLFMHRNTLQYRLDRFYEVTGLSLKNFDDLIFCYLLMQK